MAAQKPNLCWYFAVQLACKLYEFYDGRETTVSLCSSVPPSFFLLVPGTLTPIFALERSAACIFRQGRCYSFAKLNLDILYR